MSEAERERPWRVVWHLLSLLLDPPAAWSLKKLVMRPGSGFTVTVGHLGTVRGFGSLRGDTINGLTVGLRRHPARNGVSIGSSTTVCCQQPSVACPFLTFYFVPFPTWALETGGKRERRFPRCNVGDSVRTGAAQTTPFAGKDFEVRAFTPPIAFRACSNTNSERFTFNQVTWKEYLQQAAAPLKTF